jgi:hypothetical protein
MIKGELAAAADMVYSFESDSHLNPYIKEILVTAGYWSFDFLPPIGDEAWERNISKVLTQPMMEHVQNRVRQRNQQSRGKLPFEAHRPTPVHLCACMCVGSSLTVFLLRYGKD